MANTAADTGQSFPACLPYVGSVSSSTKFNNNPNKSTNKTFRQDTTFTDSTEIPGGLVPQVGRSPLEPSTTVKRVLGCGHKSTLDTHCAGEFGFQNKPSVHHTGVRTQLGPANCLNRLNHFHDFAVAATTPPNIASKVPIPNTSDSHLHCYPSTNYGTKPGNTDNSHFQNSETSILDNIADTHFFNNNIGDAHFFNSSAGSDDSNIFNGAAGNIADAHFSNIEDTHFFNSNIEGDHFFNSPTGSGDLNIFNGASGNDAFNISIGNGNVATSNSQSRPGSSSDFIMDCPPPAVISSTSASRPHETAGSDHVGIAILRTPPGAVRDLGFGAPPDPPAAAVNPAKPSPLPLHMTVSDACDVFTAHGDQSDNFVSDHSEDDDDLNVPVSSATCVSDASDGFSIVVYNIHNFAISQEGFRNFRTHLNIDRSSIDLDPVRSHLTVLGDFNFDPPGEFKCDLSHPDANDGNDIAPPTLGAVDLQTSKGIPKLVAASAPNWIEVLSSFVEIEQGAHTHYDSGSNSTSRIDRVYSYLPPWLILQLNIRSTVLLSPLTLFDLGVSDHAPVMVCFSDKVKRTPKDLPINPSVFSSSSFLEKFRELSDNLLSDPNLTWEAVDPFEKLETATHILRTAAKYARDLDSKLDPNGPFAQQNFFASAARAVFFNDIELATFLLRVSPSAADTIFICKRTYKVKLVSPSGFAERFRVVRQKKCEDEQSAICDSSRSQGDTNATLPANTKKISEKRGFGFQNARPLCCMQ